MKIEHGVVTEITRSDVHDNHLIFPEEASSIAADISDLIDSGASDTIKYIDFRNIQTLEYLKLSESGLWESVKLYKLAPKLVTLGMPKVSHIEGCFARKMNDIQIVYAPSLISIPSFAFSECPNLIEFEASNNLREIASSAFLKSYKLSKFIGLDLDNHVNEKQIWIGTGNTYSVICNGKSNRNFICVRDASKNGNYSAEYIQVIEPESPKPKIYVLKDGGYSSYAGLYFQTATDIFKV